MSGFFNPNAKRYVSQELSKAYDVNEKEKKKKYKNVSCK